MKSTDQEKGLIEEVFNYLDLNLRLPYMIDDYLELLKQEDTQSSLKDEKNGIKHLK